MKNPTIQLLLILSIIVFAILLSGCQPITESQPEVSQPAGQAAEAEADAPQLATAVVKATLSEPGQAMVTGHKELQYAVDADPDSSGLTEIGTLLAAQVTCGVFVAEKAAQELDVPLTGVTGAAAFDEGSQQVQVFLDLPGADGQQVLELANNFRQRCPIYTTLSEANSVEFTPGEQFQAGSGETDVVTAELFRFGGANVMANDHTFVIDSVPPLDGPNEELNPLDLMLGGLAACSAFVYEQEDPAAAVSVTVEADFDPSGVRVLDGPNPRMQNIRILAQTDAYDADLAARAEAQIKEQCTLYNMLEGSANITVSNEST